jgi:hypothetical protein
MKKVPPPHPLFDTLIQENNLKNDAALCRELGISPTDVSKIRHEVFPVSDSVRLKVMRRFHWTVNRLDTVIPPLQVQG